MTDNVPVDYTDEGLKIIPVFGNPRLAIALVLLILLMGL